MRVMCIENEMPCNGDHANWRVSNNAVVLPLWYQDDHIPSRQIQELRQIKYLAVKFLYKLVKFQDFIVK